MPTIDELTAAVVAADGDFVPVSQAGAMRRVTRSQLLAGVQPALALSAGALLGRSTAGTGAPEVIAVGENLRLQAGVLSGTADYSVGSLPVCGVVGVADLVGIAQDGREASVPVGQLLAELTNVPGIDLSSQIVRVPGGVGRALQDAAKDALAVEAFGAIGDGVTDDSAAIDRAVASGLPVRFGAGTYILNGQWTVLRSAVLLGIAGQTVLKRSSQSGGAWISIGGPSFVASGIVFDAGSLLGESWGVLVEAGCTQSSFERCVFQNATGSTLGNGLTVGARDGSAGSPSRHIVRECVAATNSAHGIWVQAAAGAVVEGCVAHDNGEYGICLDFNDPAFQQTVRHGSVSGCRAWRNRRGISVGNYNETNVEPPRWGNGNPDAIGVRVSDNRCHDNLDYGIAVSGRALQVVGNLVESNGSGLLVNATLSLVCGNVVIGPGQFGIDAGGSVECELLDNLVQGFVVGINPGGSQDVRVAGNGLTENVWGITAYGMETDGHGSPFGIACTGLVIEGNRIRLKDASGGGVLLADAPQAVLVAGNAFGGSSNCSASQALWAHTDQVAIRDNLWNNQARMICNPIVARGLSQIQVPDMLDSVMVTSAGQAVASIVGQHQASMAGQVSFIKVTSGGSGYTQASVTLSGSGNSARAIAYVRDGAVVGIAIEGGGSGYAASGVAVVIQGDGTGAQAVATVGLPVLEERRLRVHCNGPVRFARVGSSPFQDNWTGSDITVPQASTIDFVGTWGGWQAVAFPLGYYLAPTGDGGLIVRSVAGDVVLRPAGPGQVRVTSDGEPVGFACHLGRGSPEGFVTAPTGSDYRNLDGGVGSTLWVKRSGTGASGWAAVA